MKHVTVTVLILCLCGFIAASILANGCQNDSDCMNSGICDKSSGICTCMEGFRNNMKQGITNCSLIDCAHNGTVTLNGCSCQNGWEGCNCLCKKEHESFLTNIVCNDDNVCQKSLNSSLAYCDRSMQVIKKRNYLCVINAVEYTELLGDVANFECDKESRQCNMQVFDLIGVRETFYCDFTDCNIIQRDGHINYQCEKTSCKCSNISSKCQNEFLIFVLAGMHGKAQVECDEKTKECSITRIFLLFVCNPCRR
jgi:hypothetical protein